MPKRKNTSREPVSHTEPISIKWSTGSVSTIPASTAFITELTWPAYKTAQSSITNIDIKTPPLRVDKKQTCRQKFPANLRETLKTFIIFYLNTSLKIEQFLILVIHKPQIENLGNARKVVIRVWTSIPQQSPVDKKSKLINTFIYLGA